MDRDKYNASMIGTFISYVGIIIILIILKVQQ